MGTGKLVAVYAPFALNGVRYKTTGHTGTSNKASCDAGEARPWEPCHGWSAEYSMPVGLRAGGRCREEPFCHLVGEHDGRRVRDERPPIWANVATGVDGAGQLTGWLSEPRAARCGRRQRRHPPRHDVRLDRVSRVVPAGRGPRLVLHDGYGRLCESPHALGNITHRNVDDPRSTAGRWGLPSTATSRQWSRSGQAVVGRALRALAERAECSHPTRGWLAHVQVPLLRQEHQSLDQSNHVRGLGGVSLGGRPTLAFHTLRAGVPAGSGPTTPVSLLGDGTQGVLLATQDGGRTPWVNVSTGLTRQPARRDPPVQVRGDVVAPAEQRVVDPVRRPRSRGAKGIGLPTRAGVSNLEVGGVFDGAVANLADGDDFTVMERGICHGEPAAAPSARRRPSAARPTSRDREGDHEMRRGHRHASLLGLAALVAAAFGPHESARAGTPPPGKSGPEGGAPDPAIERIAGDLKGAKPFPVEDQEGARGPGLRPGRPTRASPPRPEDKSGQGR